MFAVLTKVNVPGGDTPEHLKMLKEEVIPGVKSAPGFIAGYWLKPQGDDATALVVFKDEASAKAAAPEEGSKMGDVTFKKVDIIEVVGNA
jgi:heme-degrading monooxygenase HmoA